MSVFGNGGMEERGIWSLLVPRMLEVAASDDDIWKSSRFRDAEVYGTGNIDVDFMSWKER
jgi:hypothetical protein